MPSSLDYIRLEVNRIQPDPNGIPLNSSESRSRVVFSAPSRPFRARLMDTIRLDSTIISHIIASGPFEE